MGLRKLKVRHVLSSMPAATLTSPAPTPPRQPCLWTPPHCKRRIHIQGHPTLPLPPMNPTSTASPAPPSPELKEDKTSGQVPQVGWFCCSCRPGDRRHPSMDDLALARQTIKTRHPVQVVKKEMRRKETLICMICLCCAGIGLLWSHPTCSLVGRRTLSKPRARRVGRPT